MRFGRLLAIGACVWLLYAYLAAVLLPLRILAFWLVVLAGLPAIAGGLFALARAGRLAPGTARNLALASVAALGTALAVDSAYTIRENLTRAEGTIHDLRLRDARLWPGEIHPRRYFPTRRNFELYKPGFSIEARVYGEAYNADGPALRESPAAARALELVGIDYHIDAHGFRERDPMGAARVFALGDSFVFGEGMPSDAIWPERLEARIGRPVYNLGISNTSPAQQIMILEHLFATKGAAFRPEHVLWMIFEGNDLEDSYAERAPRPGASAVERVLRDTPAGAILGELPASVRASSVLHRLVTGRLRWRRLGDEAQRDGAAGVALRSRVYASERFGPRVFPYPPYVDRAAQPRAYVQGHPNRPHFERALADMRALADARGLRVSVLLAPSASRLYGRHYRGHPEPSQRPHFLDLAGEVARGLGFEVVDLASLLEAYTERELLYLRDDSHWNARGNAAVAELVARHVFGRGGGG